MAITPNMACYECDRCDGKQVADQKQYMDETGQKSNDWETVVWERVDGTKQTRVLGPKCAQDWRDLRKNIDSQVTAFFNAYGKKE